MTIHTMGRQVVCKLVYGWQIDYEVLCAWLKERDADSCMRSQCTCGPSCWWPAGGSKRIKSSVPAFDLVGHGPFTCPAELEGLTHYLSVPLADNTLEAINAVADETIDALRKLAVEWGADDETPRFFSTVEVH